MRKKRPPIVTVLGHVDHGKTSLLDALRKTNVQRKEAGGITQSIGASEFVTKEGKITFVDTPGHAAFSNMRERGAKISDIALLVVAADDGVKPQTKEALEYILNAQIPYIIVFTKIDLPSADTQKAISGLEKEGILFEKRGGDIPWIELSAKTGQGLEELLELIYLVSDVNEFSGDPDADLDALIIESNKDKRGIVVSIVIRNGTLSVGDTIYTHGHKAKVKGLFDFQNKPVKSLSLSEPALIMGFSELPDVGERVTSNKDTVPQSDLQNETKNVPKIVKEQIGVVLKASTLGALEALVQSMPADVIVVRQGVGEVNENDIFYAKSARANIYAFEIKPTNNVQKLADTEGIKIYSFAIIYELLEKVAEELDKNKVKILAKAQIVAKFPYEKLLVAGCKIIEGEISPKTEFKLVRGEQILGAVTIKSLKRGKEDIQLGKAGEECGILFVPQLDFEPGDMLISANEVANNTSIKRA